MLFSKLVLYGFSKPLENEIRDGFRPPYTSFALPRISNFDTKVLWGVYYIPENVLSFLIAR